MSNWFKNLFLAFFRLFKGQSNTTQQELLEKDQTPSDSGVSQQQSAASITFYPKLVEHLELDHQQLIKTYSNVAALIDKTEFSLIAEELSTFKADLEAHLDTENIKFYGYLEQVLKNKPTEFQSMRNFRKEMRMIERTAIKFLEKWIGSGVNAQNAPAFKVEYDAIGSVLVKRIESEEKELYVLYHAI